MRNPSMKVAVVLTLCLLGAACNEGNPGGTGGLCRTGTYQMNPNNGQAYTLMRDYRFRCRDTSFDPEILYRYEECTDTAAGFFSFDVGGDVPTFQANLGEYRFIGSTLRDFGVGAGPFASGTYEKKNGTTTVEVGSFSFTEGDIESAGTIECP